MYFVVLILPKCTRYVHKIIGKKRCAEHSGMLCQEGEFRFSMLGRFQTAQHIYFVYECTLALNCSR